MITKLTLNNAERTPLLDSATLGQEITISGTVNKISVDLIDITELGRHESRLLQGSKTIEITVTSFA